MFFARLDQFTDQIKESLDALDRHDEAQEGAALEPEDQLQAAPEAQEGPTLPPLPGSPRPLEIGRLALRAIGNEWIAYYALPDTMKGAIELARVNLASIERELRRQAFMALMQEVVGDIIEGEVGVRPIWPHPPRSIRRSSSGRS